MTERQVVFTSAFVGAFCLEYICFGHPLAICLLAAFFSAIVVTIFVEWLFPEDDKK